eukprot:2950876-Prymnesium_polylepis.1
MSIVPLSAIPAVASIADRNSRNAYLRFGATCTEMTQSPSAAVSLATVIASLTARCSSSPGRCSGQPAK